MKLFGFNFLFPSWSWSFSAPFFVSELELELLGSIFFYQSWSWSLKALRVKLELAPNRSRLSISVKCPLKILRKSAESTKSPQKRHKTQESLENVVVIMTPLEFVNKNKLEKSEVRPFEIMWWVSWHFHPVTRRTSTSMAAKSTKKTFKATVIAQPS